MSYLSDRAARKNGLAPKLSFKKPPKALKRVSDKKAAETKEAKAVLGEDETIKEKWFRGRRKDTLVGICQCGCTRKSSKEDDLNFRSSCCHVFPKRLFPSVQYHKLNCVERNFWDGCHSNMDNKSMNLWPNFADWDDIKEKFHQLAPLLTDEERATKFYAHLEKLVYAN